MPEYCRPKYVLTQEKICPPTKIFAPKLFETECLTLSDPTVYMEFVSTLKLTYFAYEVKVQLILRLWFSDT